MSTSRSSSSSDQDQIHTPTAVIAFAWTLVGIPLLYGLYQTVTRALSLFTG